MANPPEQLERIADSADIGVWHLHIPSGQRTRNDVFLRLGLITVKTFLDGNEAVIRITDTGGGIPEAIRQRIFEPFFTTKEVGRGTGQGLSIARNAVVQGHGGSISFQTRMGEGTTFYVRLPIEQKNSRNEAVAA